MSESYDDFDAIVLGAGISGMVSTAILQTQGYRRVLMIDEFDRLGGNHIDCQIGPYSFDIGSLIFQDDSPLLVHFPEMLPYYVLIHPTWGKLTPQGAITGYPLSIVEDILRSGPWGCIRIGLSLLKARLLQRSIKNARDFARYWIGDYLLMRSGLESYMERFFGVAAEKVDLDFAEKRMMWIKEHASPRAMFRYLSRHKSVLPTNHQLARPRAGYQVLYQVAADKLRRQGAVIRLGSTIHRIEKSKQGFCLKADNKIFHARRIVSTIPINRSLALCGMEEDDALNSVALISLFFSFSGERGFNNSVLYNFSHEGSWKRLTVYSEFYGLVGGREYFCVEVIASQAGNSIEYAERDFREHVTSNKLFTGDLKFEGSRFVPSAYPIYVNQALQRVNAALERLNEFGIQSFGRQGGFDYQPTARVSTQTAEAHLQPTRGSTPTALTHSEGSRRS